MILKTIELKKIRYFKPIVSVTPKIKRNPFLASL